MLEQEAILGVARIRGALGHIRRHTRHYKTFNRRPAVRADTSLMSGTAAYTDSLIYQIDSMTQMTEIFKSGLDKANDDIAILRAEKLEVETKHQKEL